MMRWKLALAFATWCFTATAQYSSDGAACTYATTRITEWSPCGEALVLPDTLAALAGVQPGDTLRMLTNHWRRAAIFEFSSTMPGCNFVLRRVGFEVCQW